ncbi:MAG: hypothetical protein A4E41_01039 [Methanoregulaceae archaeon PtaU1.Bin066]|nr:MAG: hypothetical protein A4E41_01039 [Methanoregulaceae archaeon PtaU1.Bin066]
MTWENPSVAGSVQAHVISAPFTVMAYRSVTLAGGSSGSVVSAYRYPFNPWIYRTPCAMAGLENPPSFVPYVQRTVPVSASSA